MNRNLNKTVVLVVFCLVFTYTLIVTVLGSCYDTFDKIIFC